MRSLRSHRYLPNITLKPDSVVSEIMTKNVPCLPKSCTMYDMLRVLQDKRRNHDIPVVDSVHTNLLHGSVSHNEIEDCVRVFYAEHAIPNVDEDILADDMDLVMEGPGGGLVGRQQSKVRARVHPNQPTPTSLTLALCRGR